MAVANFIGIEWSYQVSILIFIKVQVNASCNNKKHKLASFVVTLLAVPCGCRDPHCGGVLR